MDTITILQEQKNIKKEIKGLADKFNIEHEEKRITRKALENFKFKVQDAYDRFCVNDKQLEES